jgi:hypothetical protein
MAERGANPVERAERWIDEQTRTEGDRPKGLEDASAVPTVAELRREQRREAAHTSYVHTQGQMHGALVGGLVFGAIGAVVGILGAVLVWDSGSAARIVLPIVVTVFAAWIGIVYWGGRTPELENETMSVTGEPEDGTTPRSPGNDDRGR